LGHSDDARDNTDNGFCPVKNELLARSSERDFKRRIRGLFIIDKNKGGVEVLLRNCL
jgi:hypothetical protein